MYCILGVSVQRSVQVHVLQVSSFQTNLRYLSVILPPLMTSHKDEMDLKPCGLQCLQEKRRRKEKERRKRRSRKGLNESESKKDKCIRTQDSELWPGKIHIQ